MRSIQSIEFYAGSKEELLPDFEGDFPYIASRSELDKYVGRFVPWHWHRPVELFYMESGALEYSTPGGRVVFSAGSGGMVNSNVLHMTKAVAQSGKTIQLLHIFDVSLIGGQQGSRIEKKYITPLVTAPQIELVPLFPENEKEKEVLRRIREGFLISGDGFGYEIKLREALADIWLMLFELCGPGLEDGGALKRGNDKIKQMMVYIHEHYPERISVSQVAAAAYLSERECFRVFCSCLHMTPVEYINSYRLQAACQMLAESEEPVTAVSHACGLGSSSYFGKVFRKYAGCTPSEYRRKWRNRDS